MANTPILSVICLAYNHEAYIEKALNGFVMQKTDFDFEIIVHDDASTDNTQNIIREYEKRYSELLRPIYQVENQKSKESGLVTRIAIGAVRGKYIAMCEGDDYWTDPYKLQKQVDFLEANPDYGLVSGDVELIDENGDSIPDNQMVLEQRAKSKSTVDFFDLLEINLINTLTVCVRADLMKQLVERIQKEHLWYVVDYWFWLQVSTQNKIRLLPESLAAYRVHSHGISHQSGFLPKRMSHIRFDAIKQHARMVKIIPKAQKVQLGKQLIGIIIKPTNTFWLRISIVGWLILHPTILGTTLFNRYN